MTLAAYRVYEQITPGGWMPSGWGWIYLIGITVVAIVMVLDGRRRG